MVPNHEVLPVPAVELSHGDVFQFHLQLPLLVLVDKRGQEAGLAGQRFIELGLQMDAKNPG
jgi:hypothetical protein